MGAPTNYYVDPAINANSGTGTIGDPYGDLQYCLNTITRDATNGDQINIKAGTAEVLAAALNLGTYGATGASNPIILRGYTSTANDGGIAEINCNGGVMWVVTSYRYIIMADLQIHSFGNNNGITLNGFNDNALIHCEVHKGNSSPSSKTLVTLGKVLNCYIHDAGSGSTATLMAGTGASSLAYGNHLYNAAKGMTNIGVPIGNIIRNCPTTGIAMAGEGQLCAHNTVYSATAATGVGIDAGARNIVINNLIVGYSGVGGIGFQLAGDTWMAGYQLYYNNTTNENMVNDIYYNLSNQITLGAIPFVNAGGGNFSIDAAVASAFENAWPASFYTLPNTTPKMERGAVQSGAGSGAIDLPELFMVGG